MLEFFLGLIAMNTGVFLAIKFFTRAGGGVGDGRG